MAETGTRNDPILAFRFQVFLGPLQGGFSECTGITLATEVLDHPEGGANHLVHKRPTRRGQTNLTLKRGIVDGAIWEWYERSQPGVTVPQSGLILVLDESGKPAVAWMVHRGYPTKVEGPSLNASQSSVAVETVEVSHHGLLRIR